MVDPVVRIENVSKAYLVGHQSGQRERYKSLRDVIAWEAQSFGRKLRDLALGRQLVQGDVVEEFWALKDVSFEIKQGEIVGLIGGNGAGKSTLLKMLSRIVEPSTGRIVVKGKVGTLLEVGTGFHPELTGRENVFLNGAILGMSQAKIRSRFDEIVAFAEVEEFLDTPVKRYSSGMYVRLAFAVAAYLDTEILLVDEVLAVGDYEFQKKCLGTMGQVSREGRTIIFVSHNMLAIRSLCNRGIFLRHGQKAFDGEITAAIEAYIQKHASATTEWQRPADRPISPIGYKSISVSLLGKQPAMKLKFSASLHCSVETAPTFIAVDVKDRLLAPVMQALPSATPFVPGKPGPIDLSFEIDLPPLVPGIYYLDLWIGHHYSKTCDYVENALGFEVADSPTPGRGYPHTLDHGSIVPNSRVLA